MTDKIAEAAALVRRLYDEFSMVGGNLHIVLDDENLENENVAWCRANVTRILSGDIDRYDDAHRPQVELEAQILDAIEPMTERDRFNVLVKAGVAFTEDCPEGGQ
jgi:hypothetical protein